MKYYAYLQNENGIVFNKFWFRGQYNTLSMDKVLKEAEQIADERNYYYDNIFVGRKQ